MRSALLALLLAGSLASACSGDHDALAARPPKPNDAGPPGDPGAPDASPDADETEDDAGGPPLDGGGAAPKPFALTIVNGIVDAEAVRLCFLPLPSEHDGERPSGVSFPPEPEGLAYGRALVAEGSFLDDFAAVDLAPYVITGALAEASSTSCEELVAREEGDFVVRALPILPAGSLGGARSALLVTTGCVGGEGHSVEGEKILCGAGYSAASPTASLLMVAMSRAASSEAIGLQAVNAFSSSPPLVVEVHPASDLVPFQITPYLPRGAILPLPLPVFYEESRFGASVGGGEVVLKDADSPTSGVSFSLGEALARAGLEPTQVKAGQNFTLIALGPEPRVSAGAWWKAATVVAVANEP